MNKLTQANFKKALKKAGHKQANALVEMCVGENAYWNMFTHGKLPKNDLGVRAFENYINKYL